MTLASEYARQFRWRDWPAIFSSLPDVRGLTVLDLGCAHGDQSAELASRGAHVVGIDGNQELVEIARARGIPNARFLQRDLCPLDVDVRADAIWCSFTAAYFPSLGDALASWSRHLKAGGWIALTEVDGLFRHRPVTTETRDLLEAYAQDGWRAGRYDFHMGGKLEDHLREAGFLVEKSFTVDDAELAFQGPAQAEVLDAWRARFDRMKLLHTFCGDAFERVRDDFLAFLRRDDHVGDCRVVCCIAHKR